jgi:hypothetical protein
VAAAGCVGAGGDAPPEEAVSFESGAGRFDAWVPFESREGNFKALFPVPPTHTTTADGKEHRYTAQLRRGRLLLRAAYEHGYDTSIPVARRFAEIAKLPDVRGAITPAAVSLAGRPGMEATYEMMDAADAFVVRHRIYHVGRTSYQVQAVAAKSERAEAEIDRFFSSFQFLSP